MNQRYDDFPSYAKPKRFSRGRSRIIFNSDSIMPAMKRCLLFVLALSSLCLAGCLGSKKDKKPKPSSAIASEVEENFKQRWIEKRGADLMTRGVSPDIARAQAIEEFKLNYGYTNAAHK